jgi:DNA polymerase-3 subunit epsilon
MDAAPDLVFVDLETTGGNAAYDRITEIAIVRVANGNVIEEWSTLVNPECPIPAYIEEFTGIDTSMVAAAPRFREIAATVLDKLKGAVFVAHNARFDYGFLRGEFRKLGIEFTARVICTVKLSRRLFPEHARHNLDAVIERHGIVCRARHRALGDALALRDFWFKLEREIPVAELEAACERAFLAVAQLPAQLAPELADELPDGPGVYRLFGDADVLLYVGRSDSLRSGVLAKLAPAPEGTTQQKLADQVRRVDWQSTAGVLGAMLLEARWLRLQQPLYNRHAKSSTQAATLRCAPDGSGRVEPLHIDALTGADLAGCFGVFHSLKDAHKALTDIACAKQLCMKILGLHLGEGSCVAFQLGRCKGACVGKERLALHNARVQLAMSALKIKSWPFAGRIALRERRPRADRWHEPRDAELHVLDQWSYLGSARSEEQLAALGASQGQMQSEFDPDVYKILLRYFSTHPKLDWHDLSAAPRTPVEAP